MVTFKIRIFTSCQTKHSSTSPEHSPPPPSQPRASITGDSPSAISPPSSKHAPRRSFKSHISSAFGCGSGSGNQSAANVVAKLFDVVSPRPKTSNSAIAGVVSDNDHDFRFPILPMPSLCKWKNRCHRKDIRNLQTGPEPKLPDNFTTSSARFSASYTLDEQPGIMSNPRKSFSDVGMRSRRVGGEVSPEWGSPARLSALMPCKMEGKVKESFAVVKRSEKPYEDFKKSMMEMIVENEIYEESDLKQLLQCFLSLNSWNHHGVIMEAFLEIWNTMLVS